jgi:hypothetical protein
MKESTRSYSMSDAELCLFASNIVVYMNRDSTEFANRGIDAAAINAFEALGNAFEIFPTDDEYVGLITIEVTAKNNLRAELLEDIQAVSGFFEQKWGLESGQYKRLGIKRIHGSSDAIFLVKSREVARVAGEYLADLSGIGLSQTMIDSLETKAQSFEDKLNAINEKKALRDEKARDRTENGNELYSYVKQYSTIGKLIWENTDEAKYNDYVIYKTTNSGLSKPQNLVIDYNITNPGMITFGWDSVDGADYYDVFYNIAMTGAPSGTYSFLNNFPASPAVLAAAFGKRNYFKIKAKNEEQTSIYSDEIFVEVPAE